MDLPKVTDLDVSNKKVLVRADLDVDIIETYRLEALLPTLKYLLEQKAEIIIIGHRGRPEPFVVKAPLTDDLPQIKQFGLAPVAKLLEKILKTTVAFIPDVCLKSLSSDYTDIPIMLENLRFEAREEASDEEFVKELANLGDIYVNEAFASSHRDAASITGLPKLLPHAAGFRFIEEVNNLSKVFDNPRKPVLFVIGGSKKDKLDYIEDLKKIADKILIGGRLPEYLGDESLISVKLRTENEKVIIGNLTQDKEEITLNTIERFEEEIGRAGTIVLAGPMGKYEDEGHRQGTERIFKAVAGSGAFKITGGGDSLSVLSLYDLKDKFDWVSVGGGAMLEFLAKKTLPGIKALESASLNKDGG